MIKYGYLVANKKGPLASFRGAGLFGVGDDLLGLASPGWPCRVEISLQPLEEGEGETGVGWVPNYRIETGGNREEKILNHALQYTLFTQEPAGPAITTTKIYYRVFRLVREELNLPTSATQKATWRDKTLVFYPFRPPIPSDIRWECYVDGEEERYGSEHGPDANTTVRRMCETIDLMEEEEAKNDMG